MADDLTFVWLPKALVYGLEQVALGLVVVRHLAHRDAAAPDLDAWLTVPAALWVSHPCPAAG